MDGKISKPSAGMDLAVGFDIGDFVQWESQGVIQFEAKKVTAISDDYTHAFVEGSATGLPVRELHKVDPPAETGGSGGSSFPSWDFFRSQKLKTPPAKVAMNQDVYTLPGGGLVLQWPASMTTDDLEDVELWLEMMKRKLKRIVTKKEQNEAE